MRHLLGAMKRLSTVFLTPYTGALGDVFVGTEHLYNRVLKDVLPFQAYLVSEFSSHRISTQGYSLFILLY